MTKIIGKGVLCVALALVVSACSSPAGSSPSPTSKTYTVHFDTHGGNPVNDITNVVSGSLIEKPSPNPTNGDLAFGGWFKDAECTKAWRFDKDTVNSTITLHARWRDTGDAESYTVHFEADGGSPEPGDVIVNHGYPVDKPASLSKADNSFGGWYDNPGFSGNKWVFDGESDNPNTVVKDTTLYAKWIESGGDFNDWEEFDEVFSVGNTADWSDACFSISMAGLSGGRFLILLTNDNI